MNKYSKMTFDTLLENNTNLFNVYNFNKIRCGDIIDGGYVIGDLNTSYDCFISAGISNNDDFSIVFIDKYKMNNCHCYGFDGTVEQLPLNLSDKMIFVKKNIGYKNDEKTTSCCPKLRSSAQFAT